LEVADFIVSIARTADFTVAISRTADFTWTLTILISSSSSSEG